MDFNRISSFWTVKRRHGTVRIYGCILAKNQSHEKTVLQKEMGTFIEAVIQRDELTYPDPKLYNNQMSLGEAEVANVTGNKPLQIHIANFGSTPIELLPLRYFAKAGTH